MAFIFLAWKKDPKTRIAFLLCLCLYFLYEVFVPVYDALAGVNSFFGFSIEGNRFLHLRVAAVYFVGISSFILAYFLFIKWANSQKIVQSESTNSFWKTDVASKCMVGYQLVVWLLVGFNIHQSGISLVSILNFQNQSEKDILFSINWYSHGIDLLSNSLSVALFLQFWIKRKTDMVWWVFFILWLTFCLLAGWRYRIILLMLFFAVYFLRTTKLSGVTLGLIALTLLISVSWLTLNRMAIAKRQFHLITFDFSQFNGEILATELSNSRTFKATLIDQQGKGLERGGISSWTDYIGNKFSPRKEFPDGVRPVPWIITATKSWIPPGWPWNPNPAVNQMEEYFLTFGWIGLLSGMFLMGVWVGFLDFPIGLPILVPLQMIGTGLCFQWISRGFFLYQIQITLASLVPFLLLYLVDRYLPHDPSKNPTGAIR